MIVSTLETNNLRLRALEPSDIDLLYLWENNMEIWNVSNTLTPFSHYALKRHIQNSQLDIYQTKQLRLAIELKEEKYETVGLVDLFDFDPFHQRAGVGIMVANKTDRNKGIATEAIGAIANYSFLTLKLNQLYCNIASSNKASLRLFKKCGFETIGVKKEWLKTANGWDDEVMMQKINSEPKVF